MKSALNTGRNLFSRAGGSHRELLSTDEADFQFWDLEGADDGDLQPPSRQETAKVDADAPRHFGDDFDESDMAMPQQQQQ
jgi:hypothetical protein